MAKLSPLFLDYLLEPFLETIKKYYRIERKEICFLKFIFEAYDGIAMLTTVDSDSGVVLFHIAPGCEDDVEMILQDLQHHIMIEEVLWQGLWIRDRVSVISERLPVMRGR